MHHLLEDVAVSRMSGLVFDFATCKYLVDSQKLNFDSNFNGEIYEETERFKYFETISTEKRDKTLKKSKLMSCVKNANFWYFDETNQWIISYFASDNLFVRRRQ